MATSVVNPRAQFFANNGRPLIGGRIHTYVAGSSTRAPTYKDAAKAQPNTNPIILDGRGEAQIYLAEGVEYKFVIEDSKGALIYTQEPVYGAVWPSAAEWPSDSTLSYQYMTEAKAAADATSPAKFYDTYAQALAAAAGERKLIEVSRDETRSGSRTRYWAEAGTLSFIVNLDQLRLDLATPAGGAMIGMPLTSGPIDLQNAFSRQGDLQIKLQPGAYDFDGQTFTILGKNQTYVAGEYLIDLTGVRLSGSGLLILDSCKRTRLKGLYAPGWDIEFRGVWGCTLEGMQWRDLILGRAGTIFNANYWNNFEGVLLQRVLVPEDAQYASNSFNFTSSRMRGDASQGFTSTRPYAFEFLGNQNIQHWRFDGDISYHSSGIYRIADTNVSDVELDLNGYFDTVIPLGHNRQGVQIIANGHHANGAGLNLSHESATRDSYRLQRGDRSLNHTPAAGVNYVPNGDLAITAPAGHPLFPCFTGAEVSSASIIAGNGSASRAILRIATSGATGITFRTLPMLTRGRISGEFVVRLESGSAKNIQFRVGGRYFQTNISSSQWHVVKLTDETGIETGTAPTLSFNIPDAEPTILLFSYVGVTQGAGGAMFEKPLPPQTLIAQVTASVASTPPDGLAVIEIPCPGAKRGDFVNWGCGHGVGAWIVSANIVSDDLVRIYLRNVSTAAASIQSGVWTVRVQRAAY